MALCQFYSSLTFSILSHSSLLPLLAILGLIPRFRHRSLNPVLLVPVRPLQPSQLPGDFSIFLLFHPVQIHPLFLLYIVSVQLFGGHLINCLLLAGAFLIFINAVIAGILYRLKANLDRRLGQSFHRHPGGSLGLYDNLSFAGSGAVINLPLGLFVCPYLIPVCLS